MKEQEESMGNTGVPQYANAHQSLHAALGGRHYCVHIRDGDTEMLKGQLIQGLLQENNDTSLQPAPGTLP